MAAAWGRDDIDAARVWEAFALLEDLDALARRLERYLSGS
jgi:ABC-type taurine transport system substrate-binding protein